MGETSDKVSGKVKEVYGAATGDRRTEAEGKAQHARGGLKGWFERMRQSWRRMNEAPTTQTRRPI
ncbi:MAG TPA: CsbD family protein [Myxococcaceae bacterium]|nr:CsbD family protein [Myxococcaceae bacterium]